jgi:RNA polymerase sigma-70 factor (ECF subfamily)
MMATQTVSTVDDEAVILGLRRGDEETFAHVLARYNGPLLRVAMSYVRDRAVAEDVVQDTWLGVIKGIDEFQGRSSLRTWIFRILINQAKSRGLAEGRILPLSTLDPPGEPDGPTIPQSEFTDGGASPWRRWVHPPSSWDGIPEERLVSAEIRRRISTVIDDLPPRQRQVITLRDVEGWPSSEVCALLRLSEANQRVLLHRARARVRSAIESYLAAS